MARIRTIKPEFWTDEKVVSIPFEARLLFIGLWNFCDDAGALPDSPERIRMQVFPSDPEVRVANLLDLLLTIGLLDRWVCEADSSYVLTIRNWDRHQKIDNPSKKAWTREGYRRLAITSEQRRAVAIKYGCEPGDSVEASCFYCGELGFVHWWDGPRSRPTKWITLEDLEFDHFQPVSAGGSNDGSNIVLACRACNRGKKDRPAEEWLVRTNPRVVLASPSEPSPLEGKGREGNGGEQEKEEDDAAPPRARAVARPDVVSEEIWSDFLKLRRAKRAPFTATAWDQIQREALKAGWGIDRALTECVARGWAGFKADWVAQPAGKRGTNAYEHPRNTPIGVASCNCTECMKFRVAKARGPTADGPQPVQALLADALAGLPVKRAQ
jgi:5-methylcytosine-specific restriction endonuclease McrA